MTPAGGWEDTAHGAVGGPRPQDEAPDSGSMYHPPNVSFQPPQPDTAGRQGAREAHARAGGDSPEFLA